MKFRWPWKRAERRAVTLSGGQWNDLNWGHKSHAGVSVSSESAMRSAAVIAAVRRISEALATTNIHLLERVPDGGRVRAQDHNAYRIVHEQPNPLATPFNYWEAAAKDLLLDGGNHFAWIEGGRADPQAIWRMPPECVTPEVGAGGLTYKIIGSQGTPDILRADEVLHIAGLGDGIVGKDPISFMRESIGHDLALSTYGQTFFKNRSVPPHYLTAPGDLDEDTQRQVRAALDEEHGGLNNSHKVAIFGNGLEVKRLAVSPEDSQWLDARKFSLADVARIFGLNPILLGETEKSSMANVVELGRQFKTFTLQPWFTRIEQALARCLLQPQERGRFYFSFNADAFTRANIGERFEAYAKAKQFGWMSTNDIRAREDMPSIGPAGDVYLEPVNMRDAGTGDDATEG